jgi:hypothetical protein
LAECSKAPQCDHFGKWEHKANLLLI